MNRPKLLVLVRHAESARNKAKKGETYFADDAARRTVKGVPDYKIPITPDGAMHAQVTGQAIRERFGTFDYIYHSGYTRTIDTTNEILKAYTKEERRAMKVRQNTFIRERDPGFTYDMTETEAETAFPWLAEYWQTFGGFFSHPPGGESLAMVVQRVYLFLGMLFRDRPDQKIMVVTHGGTLRCFRYLLEKWGYDEALSWPQGEGPGNCSVTTYVYNDEVQRLELVEYNRIY